MSTKFDRAVLAAAALLRDLPREPQSAAVARSCFRRFQSKHRAVPSRLLVICRPGSTQTDQDILLRAPGGTLTMSWTADAAVPWMVQHSEHQAANDVLSVNGQNLSVQSALIILNGHLKQNPDLMEELISSLLLREVIGAAPPPVSARETEHAVDQFRLRNGLHLAADTQKWLDETGLTFEALQEFASYSVQLRKFRHRQFAKAVLPYFKSNRGMLDILRVFRARTGSKSAVQALAQSARSTGLWSALARKQARSVDVAGELLSCHALELPPKVADAGPGAIVVTHSRGVHEVWEILQRTAARLDARTRTTIEDLLLKDWLTRRRAHAKVQWHWM